MPKQIYIPEQYAEVFRDAALEEVQSSAATLATFIQDKRRNFTGTTRRDHIRVSTRLELAEALYDQIDAQEGPLVVDVSESSLACVPFIAEGEAERLGAEVGSLMTADTRAAVRARLEALTFWVELMDDLALEYDEELARHERARAEREAAC